MINILLVLWEVNLVFGSDIATFKMVETEKVNRLGPQALPGKLKP